MIYRICLQWSKECDFEINAVRESGALNEKHSIVERILVFKR